MHEPPSVRFTLRDATRSSHARVDALFRDGFAGPADYAGYLAGMHGFLGAVWHALPEFGTGLRLLQDDMDTVGVTVPPLSAPVPVVPAERLGWRYVIDGSTLGARVLLRQVHAFGHDGERGATFLAHHADGTAWDDTRRDLDALPADADALRMLCAAAERAFAVAYDAFRDALVFHRSTRAA